MSRVKGMRYVEPPKTYLLKLPKSVYEELWEVVQQNGDKYPTFRSLILKGIERELESHEEDLKSA